MKSKIIRDPVHGYISIPDDLCRLFIDTPLFQRLRSIEQTSMRWLFPGGRHDRFIHSLGVYHLAVQLYDALEENVVDKRIGRIIRNPRMRNTFVVAALMHDCGHAPFSHTTEFLYNEDAKGDEHHNRTFIALRDIVPASAKSDFDFKTMPKKPADHEAMSALALLTFYGSQMRHYKVDRILAARMITGAVHLEPQSMQHKVENELIRLINGEAIDVDKLDYIMRDTWASGVKNTAIDIGRLLNAGSIEMDGENPTFVFRATALSVVQSVIDARNYLYEWIYGHHTVLYYATLLKGLCSTAGDAFCQDHVAGWEKFDEKKRMETVNGLLSDMFSLDGLTGRKDLKGRLGGFSAEFLTDGDLMTMFKSKCGDRAEFTAYVSHNPLHVPLWKTEAEYKVLVKSDLHYHIQEPALKARLGRKFKMGEDELFCCNGMSGKLYDVEPRDVKIMMSQGKICRFTDVANYVEHTSASKGPVPFFYVFVAKKYENKIDAMLSFINNSRW